LARAGRAARSDPRDPALREVRLAGPAARRGAGGVPAAVARPRPQALSEATGRRRGRGPERLAKLVSGEKLDGPKDVARLESLGPEPLRPQGAGRESGRRRTRRAYLASPDEYPEEVLRNGLPGDRPTPEEMTAYRERLEIVARCVETLDVARLNRGPAREGDRAAATSPSCRTEFSLTQILGARSQAASSSRRSSDEVGRPTKSSFSSSAASPAAPWTAPASGVITLDPYPGRVLRAGGPEDHARPEPRRPGGCR